jgi:formyl-CoA transferase
MGKPEVANDPRFKETRDRAKNIEAMTAIINEWTGQRSKHEVMQIMGEAGVPCGKVLNSVELLEDPHLREREMVVTINHPVRGEFIMPGCPVKLEDSPVKVESAPLLGQNNADVYAHYLGLKESDLDQLKVQGVI